MQRVHYLIEKLSELTKTQRTLTAIDFDLMLDYSRVIYADLLDERRKAGFQNIEPEKNEVKDVQQKSETTSEHITEKIAPTASSNNDLRTIIGINDKYLFISELFNGDKIAYEQALKGLSNVTSEAEAIKWVKDELHSKHNWDSSDDTVKSFYSLVSSSFS